MKVGKVTQHPPRGACFGRIQREEDIRGEMTPMPLENVALKALQHQQFIVIGILP
nr:hypothetical protein [Methylorubrum salsuginis]